MTKPKFTEGPWGVGLAANLDHDAIIYSEDTDKNVALCYGDGEQHVSANARLIAKAPEMYGTLKAIADMHTDKETDREELTALCVAMAMYVTDSIDNG